MVKRRLVVLLAAPMLAVAAVAITFAIRHHEDPDRASTVSTSPNAEGDRDPAPGYGVSRTLGERIDGIVALIQRLADHTERDPVSVRQLQLLTEELASATAIVIDAEPGELPDAAVSRYFGLAVESIEMIDGAAIADDADAARVSARGIAEFARDTVANYLVRTQFEVSRSADEVTEPRDGT